MRIISQNGFYDIPYETTVVECVNQQIFARSIVGRENGSICELGCYKTHEKALKAMEMLRERHTDNIFCREDIQYKAEMSLDDGLQIVREMMIKYEYFQFPKDEEVEV